MKTASICVACIIILSLVTTLGFQCSSSELTSARLYIQRSEWENAIKSLEQEVAKNPQNEEAWFLLGEVKAEIKDFRGMNDAFSRALGIAPTHAKEVHDIKLGHWGRYMNLGVENFNKGKDTVQYHEKAIDAFNTAILILPDSAAAYKNLGFTYLSKNELPKALPFLEKAFDLSKDVMAGRYVGEVYYDMGVQLREKFEGLDNRIEIRIGMNLAEVQSRLGDPSSKSSTKDKKVTKEKWVYAAKKLTLNFEGGELNSWEEDGKKGEREPKVYYKDYAQRDSAVAYLDKSIAALERVRQINPRNTEVLASLSNAYVVAEKTDIAMETFKSAVVTDPTNKVFHYNYGVLLMKANDFDQATREFLAAVTLDSTYEPAIYNLGVTYVNWGVHLREAAGDAAKNDTIYKEKFKLALPYLELMTRLKPQDADAWEILGKLYANLGMSKEATAVFEKADKLRKGK